MELGDKRKQQELLQQVGAVDKDALIKEPVFLPSLIQERSRCNFPSNITKTGEGNKVDNQVEDIILMLSNTCLSVGKLMPRGWD